MSLILEALRKLDRDRSAPDPGVIVVGPQSWPVARRRPRTVVVVLSAFGLVAIGFWLGSRPRPARVSAGAGPPFSSRSAATAGPTPERAAPAVQRPDARPEPRRSERLSDPRPAGPLDAPGAPQESDIAPRLASREPMAVEEAEDTDSVPAPPLRGAKDRLPRLSAIGRRDLRPIAILDDRVMNEGDSLDGVTVISIGETSVEIELLGRRHTLTF